MALISRLAGARLRASTTDGSYPVTATDGTSGRLAQLEAQMRQVTARLASLEQAVGRAAAPVSRQWPAAELAGPGGAGEPGTGEPVFVISGQGQIAGAPVAIRRRARLADVLGTDADTVSRIFAALANPARVTVLRALLDGPRTSQELRAELDDASVGQLYHHLRELFSAGLIIQPARSQYAMQRGTAVMVCAALIAAGQLAANISLPVRSEEEPATEPEPRGG